MFSGTSGTDGHKSAIAQAGASLVDAVSQLTLDRKEGTDRLKKNQLTDVTESSQRDNNRKDSAGAASQVRVGQTQPHIESTPQQPGSDQQPHNESTPHQPGSDQHVTCKQPGSDQQDHEEHFDSHVTDVLQEEKIIGTGDRTEVLEEQLAARAAENIALKWQNVALKRKNKQMYEAGRAGLEHLELENEDLQYEAENLRAKLKMLNTAESNPSEIVQQNLELRDEVESLKANVQLHKSLNERLKLQAVNHKQAMHDNTKKMAVCVEQLAKHEAVITELRAVGSGLDKGLGDAEKASSATAPETVRSTDVRADLAACKAELANKDSRTAELLEQIKACEIELVKKDNDCQVLYDELELREAEMVSKDNRIATLEEQMQEQTQASVSSAVHNHKELRVDTATTTIDTRVGPVNLETTNSTEPADSSFLAESSTTLDAYRQLQHESDELKQHLCTIYETVTDRHVNNLARLERTVQLDASKEQHGIRLTADTIVAQGAVIASIANDSAAAKAIALIPNVAITHINGADVTACTLQDIVKLLEVPGGQLELKIVSTNALVGVEIVVQEIAHAVHSARTDANKVAEEASQLQQRLNKRTAKLKKFNAENKSLKAKMSEAEADSGIRDKLTSEIDSLHADHQTLQAAVEFKGATINQLTEKLDTVQRQAGADRASLKDFQARIASLAQDTADHEAMAVKHETLNTLIKKQDAKVRSQQIEIKDLKKGIIDHVKKLSAINDLKRKSERNAMYIKASNDEIDNITAELKYKDVRISQLKDNVDDLEGLSRCVGGNFSAGITL